MALPISASLPIAANASPPPSPAPNESGGATTGGFAQVLQQAGAAARDGQAAAGDGERPDGDRSKPPDHPRAGDGTDAEARADADAESGDDASTGTGVGADPALLWLGLWPAAGGLAAVAAGVPDGAREAIAAGTVRGAATRAHATAAVGDGGDATADPGLPRADPDAALAGLATDSTTLRPSTAGAPPGSPVSSALPSTLVGGNAASTPATSPTPDTRLAPSIDSPGFAPALGAQLRLMLRDGVSEARLQLSPAELGPISVRIHLDGVNARVDLAAELAPTRHALEQALPTLAASLRDSGLTLTGGGVFEHPDRPGPDGQPRPGADAGRPAGVDDDAEPGDPHALGAGTSARGVLDVFA
ncbi:MAG: flagellar hook-length control protein FliK [Rubrivivax sp.]